MRTVYIALIAVLAGIVILFTVQNLESTTVSLLTMRLTLPLAILVFLVYVIGMLTGGLLLAFLRTSVQGARQLRT
jgi:lipopolysaccharide assembly protein A